MSATYFNKFKSTQVGGALNNCSLGQDAAYCKLDGTLELGSETSQTTTDPNTGAQSIVYTNSGGEIVVRNQGNTFTITREVLSRLVGISSNVQNQLDSKPSMNYLTTQLGLIDTELDAKANISDVAATYVSLGDDQTISSLKTFSQYPRCSTLTSPTLGSQLITKSFLDSSIAAVNSSVSTSLTDVPKLSTNNTFDSTKTNTFGPLSTTGNTSLNNGNLVVNPGAIFANRAINFYGTAALFNSSSTGGNTLSAIWRDGTSKNTFFDTTWFNNSEGGGFVFRLKDPTTSNVSDVLTLQQTGLTVNAPCTFNSQLPTSTLTPSLSSQLVTKSYVDSADSTLLTNINTRALDSDVVKLNGAQTISGLKTFSSGAAFTTSLPTSTITPTLADEFTRKGYVDSALSTKANTSDVVLLTGAQTIAGVKSFSSVPQCAVAPSVASDLTRKNYVDTQVATCAKLASANVFTSTNSFSSTTFTGNISANSQTVTPTQLGYLSGATSNIQTQLNDKVSLSSANTFSAKQTMAAGIDVSGGDLVFTGTSAAQAVKGSAAQPLVVSSMAGQTLYLNPDKGAVTTSAIVLNSNHAAGVTDIYGSSCNIYCNVMMSNYAVYCNLLSGNTCTCGNVNAGTLATNNLNANNFGRIDVNSPLWVGGGLFGHELGIYGWIININTGSASEFIPIVCSQTNLVLSDRDSLFLMAPYTRITQYTNPGYSGSSTTHTNDAATWKRQVSSYQDQLNSIKVERKLMNNAWSEVTFNSISNTNAIQ